MGAKQTSAASATDHVSFDDDVQRLRAQLDRGTSLEELAGALAASLATQVAAKLGVTTDAARRQLTTAFTAALTTGASGTGPPQTNAERALTLATRFRQIAGLATRVTNEDTGPSIRLIAGQRSDADKAGADPTPTPGSTGTLVAAPAPASPLVPSGSDGRTVATPPALAIATGGDTLLGRTLARAWLADQRRDQPSTIAATAQIASARGPLDAYVQAFAAALARADADHDHDTGTGTGTSTPSTPPAAFAIAVAHDAAPVAPPAPASTLPQTPQVDPHAVVDQVLRAMAIRTSDGQSEVRLRLVPEHLGDVSVKLVVSGGTVSASLVAHTADAQNALAGGQAQLAKTLADAGLKLQSFSVGLAGGFAGTRDPSQHSSGQRQPSATRRIGALANDDDVADDDLGLLASPSFGPPVYTASRGLANYLV